MVESFLGFVGGSTTIFDDLDAGRDGLDEPVISVLTEMESTDGRRRRPYEYLEHRSRFRPRFGRGDRDRSGEEECVDNEDDSDRRRRRRRLDERDRARFVIAAS